MPIYTNRAKQCGENNTTNTDRIREVVEFANVNGDDEAAKLFGVKASTIGRYREMALKEGIEGDPLPRLLRDIQSKFSEGELRAIAKGRGLGETTPAKVQVDFKGDVLRFGFLTDTHIGGENYKPELLDAVFSHFEKRRMHFVTHTGDVCEGMSNRPGHIYELTHLGADAQRRYAIQELSKWPGKMYLIDGNHDRWFYKSSGTIIVKDIAEALPNAEFLGHDEGDIHYGNIWIKLFHGEDTSSYATSYRIQKLIESFTGGEKPHILLMGHTHKQGSFFERHIHAVSGGALSTQSRWMRSKRMANHTGAWDIEVVQNESGVVRFTTTWIPFYV